MFAYCLNNPSSYYDPSGSACIMARFDDSNLLSNDSMDFCSSGGGVGASSAVATLAAAAVATMVVTKPKEYADAKTVEQSSNQSYTVYLLYAADDPTQTVIYVGRVKTANISARMAYHASRGRQLKSFVSGLDYATCRVLEQGGMMLYHTINRDNPLNNQIRGISPTNPNLNNYLGSVFNLIANGLYPDSAILPLSYWNNFTENEFLNLGL